MSLSSWKRIGVAVATLALTAAVAAPAQAAPRWDCRASLVRVADQDSDNANSAAATFEPVVANRPFTGCQPHRADRLHNAVPAINGPLLNAPISRAGRLQARAVNASVVPPRTAPPLGSAAAAVTDVLLTIPGYTIEARAVSASGTLTCVGEDSFASASSEVLQLRVNGEPILALPARSDPHDPNSNGVALLRLGSYTLHLNHRQTLSDGTLRQRAIWLEGPRGANGSTGGGDMVVAEVKLRAVEEPCAAIAPPPEIKRMANCTAAALTVVVDGTSVGQNLHANPAKQTCPEAVNEAPSFEESVESTDVRSTDVSSRTGRVPLGPADGPLGPSDRAFARSSVGPTMLASNGKTIEFDGASSAIELGCSAGIPVFPVVTSSISGLKVDGEPIAGGGEITDYRAIETPLGALYLNISLNYNEPRTGYPRRVRYAALLVPGDQADRQAERRYAFVAGTLISSAGPSPNFACSP